MIRSKKKLFFCYYKLYNVKKKQELIKKLRSKGYFLNFLKKYINYSNSSTIPLDFKDLRLFIHYGNGVFPFPVKTSMVGHKLGEFLKTRKKPLKKKNKK